MPLMMKRIYQCYYIVYMVMIGIMFISAPEMLQNGTAKTTNFIIGYIMILLLTVMLVFIELKLKITDVVWLVIYGLFGVVLPWIILIFDKMYIVALAIFVPLTLFNLYLKKQKIYSFTVNNSYIIYLMYGFSLLLSILTGLLKQPYWYISIGLLILPIVIELLVYFDLKRVSKNNELKLFVALISFFIVVVLLYYSESLFDFKQPLDFVKSILLPLTLIILSVGMIMFIKKDVETLVNNETI